MRMGKAVMLCDKLEVDGFLSLYGRVILRKY